MVGTNRNRKIILTRNSPPRGTLNLKQIPAKKDPHRRQFYPHELRNNATIKSLRTITVTVLPRRPVGSILPTDRMILLLLLGLRPLRNVKPAHLPPTRPICTRDLRGRIRRSNRERTRSKIFRAQLLVAQLVGLVIRRRHRQRHHHHGNVLLVLGIAEVGLIRVCLHRITVGVDSSSLRFFLLLCGGRFYRLCPRCT